MSENVTGAHAFPEAGGSTCPGNIVLANAEAGPPAIVEASMAAAIHFAKRFSPEETLFMGKNYYSASTPSIANTQSNTNIEKSEYLSHFIGLSSRTVFPLLCLISDVEFTLPYVFTC